ncbi:peptidyl-prolyl cis-trans isomerase-like 4 isoform X2 [Orbicella faveolata]|nr:peptidyl-prolyl cis-trans isomerase-like 4 isoform X2 [Orbicella faveolata]
MKPRIKHKKRGTVSMANNGDNLHGSQFFITLGEDLDYLDGVHTVFAEVVEGFDILDKLNDAICDDDNRPYQDIRINHTVILDDPFDDPSGLKIPDRSPEPTKEQLDSGRIGADEEIDDTKGKTMEEIDEMIEERELKAGTQILEMVGDIPDADIKPPDNVLFVCKLNPVTQDQDLEIIFSRFGPIKSCEVIRDQKSGESLQYAFIEFENVEDCERAYFKMDNVLIDDRRIHVDFSQSVAKVQLQKQGAKPVFPSKSDKDKPKFTVKGHKEMTGYDLVFDDGHNVNSKSENKRKKQKRGSHSDEEERKMKHSHNDDHKRNRKPDEKEKDRRHERKAHYSSSEDEPKDRGTRDKRERGRSPSSSEDDERIKRKKKSKADDHSRSHKYSDEKHQTETLAKARDHKHRRDRDHSPRKKEKYSKHDQDKQRHSEGHKSKHSSHEHKHHSSHRH